MALTRGTRTTARQPGADEPGEQQPRAGQAHHEAEPAEADREAAADVGGDHRQPDVAGAHLASADEVLVEPRAGAA